tara:strand:- start:759 stop:1667 length:909 start_codon:yes stop_codon:yes gene_type:complete
MSEVSLFEGGNPLVSSELFKSLQGVNDNLLSGSGGGSTNRRISIKGGKFREIVNGEQVNVSKSDTMNIVIVDAASIARTFYAGEYNPEKIAPPTCWSHDTQTPADEVAEDQRQAKRCMDCKQNVKGSGSGNSRACRYSQRLAVAIEGQFDKIYQLQLPATSIFGEARSGKMPLQAYARFLQAHNTPAVAIVTQMSFDENSEVPKLAFKALRALEENELETIVELKKHADTKKAITMTVAQTDGVIATSKPPVAALFADAPAKEKVKAEEAPIEEPKKVVKKSTPAPKANDDDLSDIVSAWDD